MNIITGDMFTMPTKHDNTEAICIPTNGMIKKDGNAVMGKGVALYADRQYQLGKKLAEHLVKNGNVPGILANDQNVHIISFPTKNNWADDSDIELIKQSAEHLVKIADENNLKSIYLPKIGCGCGRLDWDAVKSVISDIFDDRFTIVIK